MRSRRTPIAWMPNCNRPPATSPQASDLAVLAGSQSPRIAAANTATWAPFQSTGAT